MYQRLFFNKVAGLSPATLLKKRLWPEVCNFIKKETLAQVFSSVFCEISKNIFFQRTPLVVAFANFQQADGLVATNVFAFDYSELLQRYAEFNKLL